MDDKTLSIRSYLLSLGLYPNKCGYHYIFELIRLALEREEILPLKYVGYPRISEKFLKSSPAIEKDIQNAISYAWLHSDTDRLYQEFGETIDMRKGKPSNKHFLMTAIESLS
ncbi:MAG: sporulation initiation factor Spo0A C-terminal domain-containing protein [Clostridia bacterium]|nr:sporulation initiation factor Spo0A C-terminal domain-containing protein [Clostridia bacterium]